MARMRTLHPMPWMELLGSASMTSGHAQHGSAGLILFPCPSAGAWPCSWALPEGSGYELAKRCT